MKAKLKIVKCTTQELQAVVSLLEQINLTVKEGVWVFKMHEKFTKAFEEAAEADPDWVEVEQEELVEAPVAENG